MFPNRLIVRRNFSTNLQTFSRAHWLIFIVNKRTGTGIYYLRDASTSVCPVVDNEFRHNIVKIACRSTRQSPRVSTDT